MQRPGEAIKCSSAGKNCKKRSSLCLCLYPPSLSRSIFQARFMVGVILLFLTFGCTTVGPDFTKPSAPIAGEWIEEGNPKVKTEPVNYSDWWTVFGDPVLDFLIKTAYDENLDLQVAGLRILEARAQLGIAVGNQFPQVQEVGASYSYNEISKNAPGSAGGDLHLQTYSYALDASWELDFWGKFRRAVESSDAALIASIADYDDVLVSLTAEVASTYVLIRIFQERLAVARENVKIQENSFELTNVLYTNGAVTQLDYQQAKSLLRETQALVPTLEAGLRQAQNALCILLAIPPRDLSELLEGSKTIPKVPSEVAVGVPAQLLLRRPDIRRAELQAAAQCAQIGVAKAELFPQISILGTFGFESSDSPFTQAGGSDFSDLFSWQSFTMSTGPSIQWPVLNYGRIKNNVRVQDARFQQLLVVYRKTVLQAAREVEDSLIGFLQAQELVAFLSESVEAAKRAVEVSLIQYREGAADYTRVLNSQQFLVQAEDRLVQSRGAVPTNLISLYKALGGGWQMREGKGFVSEETVKTMESRTDWGNLLPPRDLPKNLDVPPAADVRSLPRMPDW